MTQFWREGHWRHRGGDSHWVDGHYVDRDNWDRSSWADWPLSLRSDWLIRFIHAHDLETVKSLLIPNANCPECGDEVYFFKHYNGGCAWFDDIPYPWPKHQCMEIEGTKCSSQWIAALDEAEKKIQAKERENEHAQDKVEELKTKPFAERFFIPLECKNCNRLEYEFELSNSTIRRFTDFGAHWKLSKCTMDDSGEHKRVDGAEYLNDFLSKGGRWKTKTPSKIYQWGSHYPGMYDNIGMYLATNQSIFAVSKESKSFAIPGFIVETDNTQKVTMLLLIQSLVSPQYHMLVRTKKSKIVEMAGLIFLRGQSNLSETYNISYLCMESGRAKKMEFEVLAYLSIAEFSSTTSHFEYDTNKLADLFKEHNAKCIRRIGKACD